MSLTRFTSVVSAAYRLPMEQPSAFAACVLPWLALAVAARWLGLVEGVPALAALVLGAVATGGFAVGWSRFAALQELPSWRDLAVRIMLFSLAYQMARMVETFPLPFLRLALDGFRDAEILSLAGLQLFQLLIGSFLLVLPHIALARKSEAGGLRLQRMVLAGGLSVGLGYVMGGLPFLVMTMMWSDIAPTLPDGWPSRLGSALVETLITFAALSVASAYFAKVWMELKDVDPFADKEPAPEEPEAPTRPRRTERLNRKNKKTLRQD
jgi:hypothetical protein